MNYLRFQGQVIETKPLRHTPAGIAVCEVVLQHQSTVEQAHIQRHLNFDLEAVAMGDIAALISVTEPGQMLLLEGFLAPLRKSSSRLVMHIQSFQNLNASPTVLV